MFIELTKDKYFVYLKIFLKLYSGTSVHELNPFLEAVGEPKCL
jgi:hypothetical protein